MNSFLFTLFISTGIFGLGITVIDLLGFLGDQDSDSEGDGDGDFDGDAAGDGDFDSDADADGDIDGDGDADGDLTGEGEAPGSVIAHDVTPRGNTLIKIMGFLRNIIYFCMGFGPTGTAAVLMKKSPGESLIWAVSVGIIVLTGAKLLRRVLKKDLNSVVSTSELLMEKGTVTVLIGKGAMGKVRILMGGTYVDRYAKSKNPEETLPTGSPVQVVDMDDEVVYVEALK